MLSTSGDADPDLGVAVVDRQREHRKRAEQEAHLHGDEQVAESDRQHRRQVTAGSRQMIMNE